jgi:hypothetical protein
MDKLKTLIIILIIFFSPKIKSQTKTEFGLKIGTNYAKLSPNYKLGNLGYEKYKRELGFYAGGYLNFKISERFKFQPEIIFSNQKTNIELITSTVFTGTYNNEIYESIFGSEMTESIISIPTIFQYVLNRKIYIEGGTQLGLIINQKEKTIGQKYPVFGSEGKSPLISNKKLDFGLVIGIGYKISTNFKINSRYFIGIIERDSYFKSDINVWNLGIEYKI